MKVQETTLGAVASNIQTGPFGSQLHSSDYSDEGTPVIMPQDIVDWKYQNKKLRVFRKNTCNVYNGIKQMKVTLFILDEVTWPSALISLTTKRIGYAALAV